MILHALAVLGALCVFGPLAVVCLIVIRGLRSDPYPPQAAEAPKDDLMLIGDTLGFGAPVVDSGHQMCDGPCCKEERLDRLVAAFNWDRYSTWLADPAPKEMP